jgi:hypothetical protein
MNYPHYNEAIDELMAQLNNVDNSSMAIELYLIDNVD